LCGRLDFNLFSRVFTPGGMEELTFGGLGSLVPDRSLRYGVRGVRQFARRLDNLLRQVIRYSRTIPCDGQVRRRSNCSLRLRSVSR